MENNACNSRTESHDQNWNLNRSHIFFHILLWKVLPVTDHKLVLGRWPGASFSKVVKMFRAQKFHLYNCYPLILKRWSFTMILRYKRANLLLNFMAGNVLIVFKIQRKLWHPKCTWKVSGVLRSMCQVILGCYICNFLNIAHFLQA